MRALAEDFGRAFMKGSAEAAALFQSGLANGSSQKPSMLDRRDSSCLEFAGLATD